MSLFTVLLFLAHFQHGLVAIWLELRLFVLFHIRVVVGRTSVNLITSLLLQALGIGTVLAYW